MTEKVYCDFCGVDYSNSAVSGGVLFGTKATCPPCIKRMMPDIIKYKEQHFIKARCPLDKSFRDWVISLRAARK